jgi:hypothetical protein
VTVFPVARMGANECLAFVWAPLSEAACDLPMVGKLHQPGSNPGAGSDWGLTVVDRM